ncbi:hypothetical protein [Bacillus sp. Marseille-P3661]|nr:hypothetical protein [Bacillus sp. Marseille-P3661]
MTFNITKFFRVTLGTYLLLSLTVLLLPVLLITNDISIFQSAIEFLNKDE